MCQMHVRLSCMCLIVHVNDLMIAALVSDLFTIIDTMLRGSAIGITRAESLAAFGTYQVLCFMLI